MIRTDIDWEGLRGAFAEAQPFPHVVIDDFFEPGVAEALERDIPAFDDPSWMQYSNPIEEKRAELAAVHGSLLTVEELRALRAIGDNTGCMRLKGASLEHEGPPRADRWPLDGELESVARRWGIDPRGDLPTRALSAIES